MKRDSMTEIETSTEEDAGALQLPSFHQQSSLREQVADALRAHLVSGRMRPGVLYSAPKLAAEFGVSATPVREAMLDLVSEGLVDVVRNKGFRVTHLSDAELDAMQPVYHFPGTVLSLADFFQLVCEVSGATLDRPHAPRWVVQGLAKLSEHLPRKGPLEKLPDSVVLEMATCHWGLSSLWSEQELGYRSRPPRETLSDTVEWLRTSDEGVGATHG